MKTRIYAATAVKGLNKGYISHITYAIVICDLYGDQLEMTLHEKEQTPWRLDIIHKDAAPFSFLPRNLPHWDQLPQTTIDWGPSAKLKASVDPSSHMRSWLNDPPLQPLQIRQFGRLDI